MRIASSAMDSNYAVVSNVQALNCPRGQSEAKPEISALTLDIGR